MSEKQTANPLPGGDTAFRHEKPADGMHPFARRQMKNFCLFAVLLTAVFAVPLYRLVQFALHDEFFSYIPLVPFITGYLIWIKKSELPSTSTASKVGAILAAVAGMAFLAGSIWAAHTTPKIELQDYLGLATFAYLLLLLAGAFLILGNATLRTIAFPMAFLLFMIPMPSAVQDGVESFFQLTSAVTASGFLKAAFMPVFREDLTLHLPGYAIVVAPECSGIHSTMVLLMTSLLAAHLFLRSRWKQILLVAVIVPLAIARNGFRIFVISELCVRISHDMINSPIHRRGGPIFFALALIPFFALLWYLRKSEKPAAAPSKS